MPRKSYTRNARLTRNVRKIVQQTIARNIETKFRGGSYVDTPIQDSGRTPIDTILSSVATGDTQNDRSGNQIFATGFYGKFVLQAADTTNIVRVVMYMPKDPNNAMTGVGVNSLIDQDQFTILHDRMYTVGTYNPQRAFVLARKWNRGRRRGILTQFSSTSSGSGTRGVVRLYMVSDSTAVSDPLIQGEFRYYYKDA